MEININLIPSYRKEEIEESKHSKVFGWQFFIILLMVLFFGYVLNTFNSALKEEMGSISNLNMLGSNKEDLEELKIYDEEFKNANLQIAMLENIKKERFFWSVLFMELNANIPEGIEIRSISTKKMQVFVSGLAETRDGLVLVKNNLEKNNCFESVNLPLSNLAAREKIEFTLNFFIKDSCIKNL